ncbi:dTMP kinase [Mycoplasmopsis mucosicanis]|uniref:Thymidylate kinase n=1 Tax=Mycoplasmopsis mucosicanis TaxID=458208 RepID=A0A507SK14_9BACT|nr:dTMP kinase [Mycoplasmopsis mucosicanis]TQC51591.1 dTMP kinase [Mycoplasmopsis mucosicanis]
MFITFEGPDASGKTTIISKLTEFLSAKFPNLKYITTREPGGKNIVEAEKIRKIILDKNTVLSPEAEAMLYSASRRIHLERVIWPALKENNLVICDRYVDSFFAYQGIARNLGLDFARSLTNLVIENTMPDITFFLKITPEQSKARLDDLRIVDEHDRMDKESDIFRKKVYEGYLALIENEPDRFIVIDASRSVEEVKNEIISKLLNNEKFSKWLCEVGENVTG